MGKRKLLITAALPYANGVIHFGHLAGAYLPSDCYARYQRLQGSDVLYLCGSDEYGVAVSLSAELAHRSPKDHVDLFHGINSALFQKLLFSFDHYGRTTWEGHTRMVQEFYQVLQRNGLIEEREQDHLYSEREERFLADRYVVGTCPRCGYEEARGDECQRCAASYEAIDLLKPRSKLTNSPLVRKPSSHLYYLFDKFQQQLAAWLPAHMNWKENVVRFAMGYVDALKARGITRDSNWGVPVPGAPGKVFYVWFDAPIGYISIAQQWAEKSGDPQRWKDYWLSSDAELVHFIGKDNIPFHAVFFPAMLMGQNLPYTLPDAIPANEFYLLEGRQFSKSDGWTIDLQACLERYSPDEVRYVLAATAPENADSSFSWKEFQMRLNAELLGKFGNFIHRVLTFAWQHCEQQVPAPGALQPLDTQFLAEIERLLGQISESYNGFHLRKASQQLMELAQLGNVYIDQKKPWQSLRHPGDAAALKATIYCAIQCIKALTLAASPIMPALAQQIWEQLGYENQLEKSRWSEVQSEPVAAGQRLREPRALFRKMEDQEVEEEVRKLGSAAAPVAAPVLEVAPQKETIDYELFGKLDLRVAQIIQAERVVKSKKLLKLQVDLGNEQRTIVSGIALRHTPEALIGKKVIIIANLAPATIMGIESRGMLLVAGDELEVPQLQSAALGSQVH